VNHPWLSSLFDYLINNWQGTEATKIITQFSAAEISSAFIESFSAFERKISKMRPMAVCLFARHNSKTAEHICLEIDVGEFTKRTVRWQQRSLYVNKQFYVHRAYVTLHLFSLCASENISKFVNKNETHFMPHNFLASLAAVVALSKDNRTIQNC